MPLSHRVQVQHSMGAVLGGAKSAANRRHRPDARNEALELPIVNAILSSLEP
jgi:hypothetical protein